MSIVVKTSPLATGLGQAARFSEPFRYGGKAVRVGDEAFIWFAEQNGGSGLSYRGRVMDCAHDGITVLIEAAASGSLQVSALAPYRDSADARPEAELARKLYRHAHNKIAAINSEAADFLRSFFNEENTSRG